MSVSSMHAKRTKDWKYHLRLVVWALMLCVLVFGVMFCSFISGWRTRTSTPGIEELRSRYGVALPDSTRITGSYLIQYYDGHVFFAQIEIAPKDIGFLIKSLAPSHSNPVISYQNKMDVCNEAWRSQQGMERPVWWNPDAVQRFTSLRADDGYSGTMQALISLDEPNRARVYLYHHGMQRW